jgi:hypothetical protein
MRYWLGSPLKMAMAIKRVKAFPVNPMCQCCMHAVGIKAIDVTQCNKTVKELGMCGDCYEAVSLARVSIHCMEYWRSMIAAMQQARRDAQRERAMAVLANIRRGKQC